MDKPELLLEASRFRVVRHRQEFPGGVRIRESVQHPGAVAILPILEGDRICLIRNYRIAVDTTLIELPAGTLDPGENPAEAAVRELAEETGYRAGRIEKLGELSMSPGILNERMHLFVATQLASGKAELELGEEIETLVVSFSEALQMIASGQIQDAKTVACLLMFAQQRAEQVSKA